MTRSFLRAVARGLVGVVLMAQTIVSAYACPAMALPATATMPIAQMSNCDDMAGAMDASSPNLCAEHCKYGQQSDQAPTLNAPAAVLTALYLTPLVPKMAAPPPRRAAATLSALVAASPPHAILHCVYRI